MSIRHFCRSTFFPITVKRSLYCIFCWVYCGFDDFHTVLLRAAAAVAAGAALVCVPRLGHPGDGAATRGHVPPAVLPSSHRNPPHEEHQQYSHFGQIKSCRVSVLKRFLKFHAIPFLNLEC